MTTILQAGVGALLLFIASVDAFITVFSGRGGGWLTNFWTRKLWSGLLGVHKRRSIHRTLAFAGPIMLLGIVLVWYLLLIGGWTLIFWSSDTSVMNSDKQYVTNWYEKLFFVGVTLSTLGYGNMVPKEPPWTMLGNITALSGTILITAGLSYILSVMTAGLERRQLASSVFNVGTSVSSFIRRSWVGDDRCKLDPHLLSIASDISQHALNHVRFPVLRYFHSDDWSQSPSRAVLLFSDAVFLISHGASDQARPPASVLHVCERSIANYVDLASYGRSSDGMSRFEHRDDADQQPEHLTLDTLHELGLETRTPADFTDRWKDYAPRREKLVQLCREDGWQDIA